MIDYEYKIKKLEEEKLELEKVRRKRTAFKIRNFNESTFKNFTRKYLYTT